MKDNTYSETLGGSVDRVIESVAEVRHLGQMSREHACYRAPLGHGAGKLFGGGVRVLRRQQRSALEPRRTRFAEVVKPIVVGPRCSSGKVTLMQAAARQSCRRRKHHNPASTLRP